MDSQNGEGTSDDESRSMKKSLSLLLFCKTALGLQVQDLGTLGGDLSVAEAINNSNMVVGSSEMANGETHSFLYSHGHFVDLEPFRFAANLNENGQIAGVKLIKGTAYPAVFDAASGDVSVCGSFGGTQNGLVGQARAINVIGQAVGYSFLPDNFRFHAFLWTNGVMQDLGCLPGQREGACYALANDVNDRGIVVGAEQPIGFSLQYAFAYMNGTMQNIAPFGSESSSATAVNASGQIVGFFLNTEGKIHGFLRTGATVEDIGVGLRDTRMNDVNDDGVVVGTTRLGEQTHAVIYEHGELTDLNSLLSDDSDVVLTQANGINNAGVIAGVARVHGKERAVRIIP